MDDLRRACGHFVGGEPEHSIRRKQDVVSLQRAAHQDPAELQDHLRGQRLRPGLPRNCLQVRNGLRRQQPARMEAHCQVLARSFRQQTVKLQN